MEIEPILYYDGVSARSALVRVLILDDHLYIYPADSSQDIQRVSLPDITHNEIGATHYLYLQPNGLQYLQFTEDQPYAAELLRKIKNRKEHWTQKLLKQRAVVLVLLLIGLAIGVYWGLVQAVSFIGTRLIGVEQEIKIGNQFREVMLQQEEMMGAEIDTPTTRHLQAFANGLKLSDTYPIRVTVVKSKIVNAYALPGGQLIVYSGILEKIQTPESLTALLAHESTHVNQRHSLKSLLRNSANGILISILFGNASGITGALVNNAETLSQLSYSRSLEEEADQKGMDLMLANHVNIQGMRQLMQTLEKEGDLPESLAFFSSHPLTKKRIENADHYIRSYHQFSPERKDLAALFQELKQD